MSAELSALGQELRSLLDQCSPTDLNAVELRVLIALITPVVQRVQALKRPALTLVVAE